MRTIEDLRERLFDTMDALSRESNPMDPAHAAAILSVAQVIVNAAKVECEHMKLTRTRGTGFIPLLADDAGSDLPLDKRVTQETVTDQHDPDAADKSGIKTEIEITEVAGFKAGDRVFLPSGKHGTVQSVTTGGRINVEVDGLTMPYSAKHLSKSTPVREPIRSPTVPQGRVIRGSAY